MRIGVLTAGGDAPGLNAAIRAIGQMAVRDGHEVRFTVDTKKGELAMEVGAQAAEKPERAGGKGGKK